MASSFQLQANRRNAGFSTGPRTEAGKAASARNAVKHNLTGTTFAILPGEDVGAFERLSREYAQEWKPKTPHETFLVNSMVQARWRLDRIARMEAEAFDQLLNVPMADGKTDEGALVALYPMRGQLLDKLQRYARENERAYHRAVRELKAYRKVQAEENKQRTPVDVAERNEPKCEVLCSATASGVSASSGFNTACASTAPVILPLGRDWSASPAQAGLADSSFGG